MSGFSAPESQVVDSFRVGIIRSCFNDTITKALYEQTCQHLTARGIQKQDIQLIDVPGAMELPYTAQCLAKAQLVDVIIVLGAVIRGDTSHYDLVCESTCFGCQQVSLEQNIPIVFGVLTTENEDQCWERLDGRSGKKGIEFADCAIKMFQINFEFS